MATVYIIQWTTVEGMDLPWKSKYYTSEKKFRSQLKWYRTYARNYPYLFGHAVRGYVLEGDMIEVESEGAEIPGLDETDTLAHVGRASD